MEQSQSVIDVSRIVNHLFPGSKVEDTNLPGHKIVTPLRAEKRVLLYVKSITGEPAFFNMSISGKTFGPELIHEDDFRRLQFLMRDLGVDQCAYVILSTDKHTFAHQFTFPLDKHFIEWITDD
jgi:hypothetical protein